MPYFTLALIKMTYAFQTLPLSENNTVSCDDPIFSPRLALPVATTLDIVVSQFVTSQLVKSVPKFLFSNPIEVHHDARQYPLLFGPFKVVEIPCLLIWLHPQPCF